MKRVLVVSAVSALSCISPKSPEIPNCVGVYLQEKVGFETVVNPENNDPLCYKIFSKENRFVEYLAHCKPVPGNFECYRDFAGSNKGEMQVDYISGSPENLIYSSYYRYAYGTIWTRLPSVPEDAPEKFELCAKQLDRAPQQPKVCKELQEYKKK